jgi:hypothetical protein
MEAKTLIVNVLLSSSGSWEKKEFRSEKLSVAQIRTEIQKKYFPSKSSDDLIVTGTSADDISNEFTDEDLVGKTEFVVFHYEDSETLVRNNFG